MTASEGGAAPKPRPRGPLSAAVCQCFDGSPGALPDTDGVLEASDPLGDDLQLALYACYELHYRGFRGVDPAWEWEPHLLAFRGRLEDCFAAQVYQLAEAEPGAEPEAIGDLLFDLVKADAGPSVSEHLERDGTAEQFRELMIHRSPYQLKEADPHTWALPRLTGKAKSAMVEIQADEYGGGDPDRIHSQLFANSMAALGLDSAYGAYLDLIPGASLATVNLISLLGLHRRHRGALVGHLAMVEIGSAIPNRRYAKALRRLGFEGDATEFFDEHVEADSVHENIAAYDLAQGLALAEPELTDDIVFGARTMLAVEGIAATRILEAWQRDESSLLDRAPLVATG